jgi:hypothetical protein
MGIERSIPLVVLVSLACSPIPSVNCLSDQNCPTGTTCDGTCRCVPASTALGTCTAGGSAAGGTAGGSSGSTAGGSSGGTAGGSSGGTAGGSSGGTAGGSSGGTAGGSAAGGPLPGEAAPCDGGYQCGGRCCAWRAEVIGTFPGNASVLYMTGSFVIDSANGLWGVHRGRDGGTIRLSKAADAGWVRTSITRPGLECDSSLAIDETDAIAMLEVCGNPQGMGFGFIGLGSGPRQAPTPSVTFTPVSGSRRLAMKTGSPVGFAASDWSAEDVFYAAFDGGQAPRFEQVDDRGGRALALALDDRGQPHLVYSDVGNRTVKYARRDGGAWAITELATDVIVYATSVAIDAQGRAVVAWGTNAGDFVISRQMGDGGFAAWPFGASYWTEPYLTLTRAGAPAFCAHRYSGDDLIYGVLTDAGWATQTVEATGAVGRTCTLLFDSNGSPHLFHQDHGNQELRHLY